MGGNMSIAYPYPAKMRATRDLLRRRTYLVRQRGRLLAHIQNPGTQYNRPSFEGKKISPKFNHEAVAGRFEDPSVNLAISADLTMIDAFSRLIRPLENKIEKIACQHDPNNLYLLKTIPGVGQILALTILYEVHDIKRFKTVQRFCSYLANPVNLDSCLVQTAYHIFSGACYLSDAHSRKQKLKRCKRF